MNNDEMIKQLQEEKEKILKINATAEMEREKALAESLSSQARDFTDSIQRRREERYQEMIDELPPIESPMDRRR